MNTTGTTEPSRGDGAGGHEPPAWSEVLWAQLRLLARKQWKVLGLLAAGAALVAFLGLSEINWNPSSPNLLELLLGSPIYVFAFVLAIGWAMGVWSDEGPGDRAYHWSLPVSRPVHDLTRVGLGGVSYVLVGAVGLAVGSLAFVIGGGFPSLGQAAQWGLIAFGLLTGFLLGTIPALVSEHPLRWAFGVPFGYALVTGLLEEAAEKWSWLEGVEAAVKSVWQGSHGLQAAVFAPHQVSGYAEEAVSSAPVAALLLWFVFAAAAVVAVGFVHLEQAKGAAE